VRRASPVCDLALDRAEFAERLANLHPDVDDVPFKTEGMGGYETTLHLSPMEELAGLGSTPVLVSSNKRSIWLQASH
jgi:hypothetical protein